MQNLLRIDYEKILLLRTINFRGDYPTRKAFEVGLIEEGKIWIAMIASRNRTPHTYNKATAETIVNEICQQYLTQFRQLQTRFTTLVK